MLPEARHGPPGLESSLLNELRLGRKLGLSLPSSALRAPQVSSALSCPAGPTLRMYSPAQVLCLGAGLRAEVPVTDLLLYEMFHAVVHF